MTEDTHILSWYSTSIFNPFSSFPFCYNASVVSSWHFKTSKCLQHYSWRWVSVWCSSRTSSWCSVRWTPSVDQNSFELLFAKHVILCTCKLEHVATTTLSLVFDFSALGQKDGDLPSAGREAVPTIKQQANCLIQHFTWMFEAVPDHIKLQVLN